MKEKMFIVPFSRITINVLLYWPLHIYFPIYNLSVKATVYGCLFKLASVAEASRMARSDFLSGSLRAP